MLFDIYGTAGEKIECDMSNLDYFSDADFPEGASYVDTDCAGTLTVHGMTEKDEERITDMSREQAKKMLNERYGVKNGLREDKKRD